MPQSLGDLEQQRSAILHRLTDLGDLRPLYARPYNAQEPVVCVDEKSKQLLRQTRAPIPAQPGQ